ncbi:hypothetical protein Q7P36_010338 [Cladosporium allicinum]
MALHIASLLLVISPVIIAGQDFVVGSSDSGACIGSYCCDGSLIGGTGNSNDASDFTCCLGDPNHGIINGVPDMTCSAGSAVPLTAATGSIATTSATRTSGSSSSASSTSDNFSNDDSDDSSNGFNDESSSTSTDDGVAAITATATASNFMSASTTSQRSSASSSPIPTSSTSGSASSSSESASAGATGNAAVGGYQLSAGHIAVGLLALGYNIAL